jgi:predicted nucleic acid-binding protein
MDKCSNSVNFKKDNISIDSNIIIDFYETGSEKILFEVFKEKIYFSSLILKEIEKYDLSNFKYIEIKITSNEETEYFYDISNKFSNKLSEQDIHLITICKFNNFCCASNEKNIRDICKKEGINILGSITILKEAIKIKLIDNIKAKEMLNIMKKSRMWLGETLYNETLRDFDNCSNELK